MRQKQLLFITLLVLQQTYIVGVLLLPSLAYSNDDPIKRTIIYKENAFLGISHRVVDTSHFKQKTSGFGFLVDRVIKDTPADKIGLRAEDIIIAVDDNDLSGVAKEKRQHFLVQYIRNKQMGDKLRLTVLRKQQTIWVRRLKERVLLDDVNQLKKLIDQQGTDSRLDFSINNQVAELHLTAILTSRSMLNEEDVPDNNALFPEYETIQESDAHFSHYAQQVLQAIEGNGLAEPYENLLQRLGKDELWDDRFRLNLIRYLHRDPLKSIPVVDRKTDELVERIHQDTIHQDTMEQSISLLADWLDIALNKPEKKVLVFPQYPDTTDIEAHQAFIKDTLEQAEDLRKQAFSRLSLAENTFLKKEMPVLLGRFEKSFYIDNGKNQADRENNIKVIDLAKKVDFESLFQSAQMMARFLDKNWLVILEKSLKNQQSITMNTASGKVLIGGFGNNTYTSQYALLIDFSGNDTYRTETSRVEEGVSVVIDLAGNDEYQHTRNYAQGAAFMGVGIIDDQQGNDVYTAKAYSQGFSLLGVGLLIDEAGNDCYFSNHLSQATAFWGISLLLDKSGNDRYHANYYAQGVGGTKGVAALIDSKGDDDYFATGERESSYHVSGIFLGASQGVGIGFRGYSSGGVGLLLDEAGVNHFRAGNFSQGVGYFFGLGIIKSSGQGADHYQASRYSQGSSAHSAIGVLIDNGGNDTYRSFSGVSQASSWDLAVAGLWDKSGDDKYQGSNAFAAQNGFSLFIDQAGSDHYQQILTGESNNYHGGYSLGVFIDAQGDDKYLESSGFTNHQNKVMNEYNLFIDK